MGSGIEKSRLEHSVYSVLLGQSEIEMAMQSSPTGKFDVLPANRELAGAEIELVDVQQREGRLKAALLGLEPQYDFIIIDCPPALNLADRQCLDGRPRGSDPDAVRILCFGRTKRSGADLEESTRSH